MAELETKTSPSEIWEYPTRRIHVTQKSGLVSIPAKGELIFVFNGVIALYVTNTTYQDIQISGDGTTWVQLYPPANSRVGALVVMKNRVKSVNHSSSYAYNVHYVGWAYG